MFVIIHNLKIVDLNYCGSKVWKNCVLFVTSLTNTGSKTLAVTKFAPSGSTEGHCLLSAGWLTNNEKVTLSIYSHRHILLPLFKSLV